MVRAPDLSDANLLQPNTGQGCAVEEPHPRAQQDRHDVNPQLGDQAGVQQLADDVNPADHGHTTVTALSPAAAPAPATARSTPSVTNVNLRRSFSFGLTCGGWWVTTKIGTWNS